MRLDQPTTTLCMILANRKQRLHVGKSAMKICTRSAQVVGNMHVTIESTLNHEL